MQKRTARGLFLADTHLGNGRTKKSLLMDDVRDSFFENFLEALKPAFEKKVDFVIHGGDLFYRSRFPEELIYMVFEPINAVAALGIPFIIVPGNHERSKIRTTLFTKHENVYIFSKPRTFTFDFNGIKIALAGFPNDRNHIKQNFKSLVKQTSYHKIDADVKLLCMHQTVEGAKIANVSARDQNGCHSCENRNPESFKKPNKMGSLFLENDNVQPNISSFYTFGFGDDVIPCKMLPDDVDLILSGHIHRHQILQSDLNGNKLKAHVIYAGSTERTSIAENAEEKGYITLDFTKSPENLHEDDFTKQPDNSNKSIENPQSSAKISANITFHPLHSEPIIPRNY